MLLLQIESRYIINQSINRTNAVIVWRYACRLRWVNYQFLVASPASMGHSCKAVNETWQQFKVVIDSLTYSPDAEPTSVFVMRSCRCYCQYCSWCIVTLSSCFVCLRIVRSPSLRYPFRDFETIELHVSQTGCLAAATASISTREQSCSIRLLYNRCTWWKAQAGRLPPSLSNSFFFIRS